jgi:hypothetical protein
LRSDSEFGWSTVKAQSQSIGPSKAKARCLRSFDEMDGLTTTFNPYTHCQSYLLPVTNAFITMTIYDNKSHARSGVPAAASCSYSNEQTNQPFLDCFAYAHCLYMCTYVRTSSTAMLVGITE